MKNNSDLIEIVNKSNFEFLSEKLPELSSLGAFAEQYIYIDPASAGVKLRSFAEKFVETIYSLLNISLPEDEDKDLYNLIKFPAFSNSVPQSVIHLLHSIRILGNKAAHGSEISSDDAEFVLRQAFDLGKWIYATYCGGSLTDVDGYKQPEKTSASDNWEKEKLEILKNLYDKEAKLQASLVELEQERLKSQKILRSKSEIANFVKRGNEVSSELQFSEEQTRRVLIEELLNDAGWRVGKNGKDTDEVRQEVEVDGQPTTTGIGYADYVLYEDNGKPIAVIEAKKTSKDVGAGRTQAKLYADSLEKNTGQRPVIFYTNGYDIHIWNDANNDPPRPIFGFYSQDSLQYLLFQRSNRVKASGVKINYDITDRPYQIEAIKRVTEKFENSGRKALIVQATGTGKTRVAISICDVLTRTNWVKRILFLCDRRELRKQAKNVFTEYLPGSPLTILNTNTSKDRDKRIYLATYPAMNQYYQNFDVGFFDLIIADESHRSIYKAYRDIFSYFDCLQIGLTATPVSYVNRHTFKMFDCKTDDPTAHFSYDDAITDTPQYLSTYEVFQCNDKVFA